MAKSINLAEGVVNLIADEIGKVDDGAEAPHEAVAAVTAEQFSSESEQILFDGAVAAVDALKQDAAADKNPAGVASPEEEGNADSALAAHMSFQFNLGSSAESCCSGIAAASSMLRRVLFPVVEIPVDRDARGTSVQKLQAVQALMPTAPDDEIIIFLVDGASKDKDIVKRCTVWKNDSPDRTKMYQTFDILKQLFINEMRKTQTYTKQRCDLICIVNGVPKKWNMIVALDKSIVNGTLVEIWPTEKWMCFHECLSESEMSCTSDPGIRFIEE
jgi:hypothetical protein